MPYKFEWTVLDAETRNDFGHREFSDGDVVRGEYYVLLPDGRVQTVTYSASDQTGFVAQVEYVTNKTNKHNNFYCRQRLLHLESTESSYHLRHN
ncbi:UNVERIFIED_CONTAM: hypothetical protein GTU68_051832 [Idotea baltica]|nr:hypothetical protein [Idotea baltica]